MKSESDLPAARSPGAILQSLTFGASEMAAIEDLSREVVCSELCLKGFAWLLYRI